VATDEPADENIDTSHLTLVFLTLTLREARRAEALLDECGVTYVVRAQQVGRTIFGLPRTGACFYVAPSDVGLCAARLTEAGFGEGVIVPDHPDTEPSM
jgi:hypothetical protein